MSSVLSIQFLLFFGYIWSSVDFSGHIIPFSSVYLVSLVFVVLSISSFFAMKRFNAAKANLLRELTQDDLEAMETHLERLSKRSHHYFSDIFIYHDEGKPNFECFFEIPIEGIQGRHIYMILINANNYLSRSEKVKLQINAEEAVYSEKATAPEELADFLFKKHTIISETNRIYSSGIARIDYYGGEQTRFHFATSNLNFFIERKENGNVENYPKRSFPKHTKSAFAYNIYKFDLFTGDRICFFDAGRMADHNNNQNESNLQDFIKQTGSDRFEEMAKHIHETYPPKVQTKNMNLGISFVGIKI